MLRLIAFLACACAFSALAQVRPPPLAVRAFALVDIQSGATLASQAEDDHFEPASLAKLMTAYVVFDALRAGKLQTAQPVIVASAAPTAPGARMYLEAGMTVPVEDLLRGLIVASANDAAVALAVATSGNEESFVEAMNTQARRLGLANTKFVNATGLPSREHHITARDAAALAFALLRDFPERQPLFAQKEFTWGGFPHASRNRLLAIDPAVDGLMSGFTEGAGYSLAASATRGDRKLVGVVLGAQTDALRTAETLKLLNFGFLSFETRRLYRKGAVVGTPEIFKGTRAVLPVGFDRDAWLTLPKGKFDGLQAVLQTQQPYVAPFARGQKAGIMKLTRDNAPLAEFPVVALEEVPVAGFLTRGWDTLRLLFR
ncbi:D-alanyl-D-alanine carboxypeptidase family protein [Usitatibacter palustris]|uniref:serine-type D-Ala-D-Ala carboxypeptidase n=1 Tax=Usitatibacter palustris TaxID=2732487 RepID=A0A6M4HE01_9PROT|nr:D-alanyl-D-alanine carboxypeptidase family protein [Usitatibacter palustris]QJR16844.1 D-alanyl-D-alanine carboxypeptidase DacC [Usitatibacter palustris]